jgi:hypothetical protein
MNKEEKRVPVKPDTVYKAVMYRAGRQPKARDG